MLFSKQNYRRYEKNKRIKKKYKIYLKKNSKVISIINDIPLKNKDNTFNMICEIPKYTRKKMEINWKKKYNPIQQDLRKDGSLREYKWGDMLFNYGAFPQTWENPKVRSKFTKKLGDNDPLDVMDIGDAQADCGVVYKVKVLGVLGMIDQNEMDWKIIAINVRDPFAKKINNINDIEKYKPGVLKSIREWLRLYKTVDGKKKNKFSFNEKYKDKIFAYKVICEAYHEWKKNKELFLGK